MQEYSNEQIDALGVQIGCTIKVERLRKKLSQEDLGLLTGLNNTTIGRIERCENNTNWKYLLKISQALNLDFYSLFNLKSLSNILLIIEECLRLEDKLTTQKQQYYLDLKKAAKTIFSNIKS